MDSTKSCNVRVPGIHDRACRLVMMVAMICMMAIADHARAADPVVVWRRSDWAPIHPDTGPQSQEESGEDWWYDHKTSHDDQGKINGFIAGGYTLFANHKTNEASSGGCLATSFGGIQCSEFEEEGHVKGSPIATMALIDAQGANVWYQTYNDGHFARVIQTSDGGYLGVGQTGSTRNQSGGPLYYNPGQTPGQLTDQFDAGEACIPKDNVPHMVLVKTLPSGAVDWQYIYGLVPYRDPQTGTADPSAAYHASADGWDVVEMPGGGYRIVGNALDPSAHYECAGQKPMVRAAVIEVDVAGHWVWGGYYPSEEDTPNNATAITTYTDGDGVHYVVSGTEYFHGDGTNEYTACDLYQRAWLAQLDDAVAPPTWDWIRSSFAPNSSASQRTDDVQISVRDGTTEILLPVIVGCAGCLYEGYNSGTALVYRLDTSGQQPIASNLGTVTARDLRLRVTPTADGGFAAVSTKLVNPPPPPFDCHLDTRTWNTDAYVGRYDAAGNMLWEKTFDVDDAAPQPYPGDLKKQESLYSISQDADGFVVSGYNSYNWSDNYLAKIGLCTPPPPNMVSWWGSGVCTPDDAIGPNHGTYVGLPICSFDAVVGQTSLYFDAATSTYIKVHDNWPLQIFGGDFSIDAWIRTGPDAPIMQKGYWNGPGFSFGVDASGVLEFSARYDTETSTVTLDPVTGHIDVGDDQWHHVALVVHRGLGGMITSLYVDGALDEESTISIVPGSFDSHDVLVLGAAGNPNAPHTVASALMDEIELFQRALDPTEIEALFRADRAGKCECTEPPDDMLAWWPLDESAGPTAVDLAGGHDATYVGNPLPASDGRVAGAVRVGPGQLVTDGTDFDFGTGDFSIDAWVKLEADPTELWIVGRGDHSFHFAASSGPSFFPPHFDYDDACGTALWPQKMALDTWTHLAVTVQRNTPGGLKMYFNGRLVGTQNTCAYNIAFPGKPLAIGNLYDEQHHHWVDEVEVFRRVLAPEEVLAIYEARSGGKCKPYDPFKAACGNGIIDQNEQCDDHGQNGGDGCSATCRLESCGPSPQAGCRLASPFHGAELQISNAVYPNDRKDRLKWKWKGQATTMADFANPTTTANYVLCVYDASAEPQPLMSRAAPVGGSCKGKPCWRSSAKKFQYGDPLLTPDGLQKLTLAGGVDGRAKIGVTARGQNLQSPTLPLTLPVVVQLVNTESGACWESTFSTASSNTDAKYKAKSD